MPENLHICVNKGITCLLFYAFIVAGNTTCKRLVLIDDFQPFEIIFSRKFPSWNILLMKYGFRFFEYITFQPRWKHTGKFITMQYNLLRFFLFMVLIVSRLCEKFQKCHLLAHSNHHEAVNTTRLKFTMPMLFQGAS